MTCIHHYGVRQSISMALNACFSYSFLSKLLSPSSHPSYCLVALSFPRRHIVRIIQSAAFWGWLLSLSDMHASSGHTFSWAILTARFCWASKNIPLSGGTASVYPFAYWRISYSFQVLEIMNKPDVHSCVQVFFNSFGLGRAGGVCCVVKSRWIGLQSPAPFSMPLGLRETPAAPPRHRDWVCLLCQTAAMPLGVQRDLPAVWPQFPWWHGTRSPVHTLICSVWLPGWGTCEVIWRGCHESNLGHLSATVTLLSAGGLPPAPSRGAHTRLCPWSSLQVDHVCGAQGLLLFPEYRHCLSLTRKIKLWWEKAGPLASGGKLMGRACRASGGDEKGVRLGGTPIHVVANGKHSCSYGGGVPLNGP